MFYKTGLRDNKYLPTTMLRIPPGALFGVKENVYSLGDVYQKAGMYSGVL